jgi:uncharacterized protein YerC
MGKSGMPVDHEAWEARKVRAIKLLELGYSYSTVGKSVGASKAWVQRVAAEQKQTVESETS